jgi:hypothetical protein
VAFIDALKFEAVEVWKSNDLNKLKFIKKSSLYLFNNSLRLSITRLSITPFSKPRIFYRSWTKIILKYGEVILRRLLLKYVAIFSQYRPK